MNPADARAVAARGWHSAATALDHADHPRLVLGAPCPPGWCVWSLGTARACLPALRPSPPVPPSVRQRYAWRVLAALTGRCPACQAAASLTADPETHRAGWAVGEVTVGIAHEPDPETGAPCPAVWTEDMAHYLDERAVRP